MASKIDQLVEVVFQLTNQSGQAATQIIEGINGIIQSLERLNKSSGKKSTESVEAALKAVGKFAGPAKTEVDALSKSFSTLTKNVNSAKQALDGLTVPKGVTAALQAVAAGVAQVAEKPKSTRTQKATAVTDVDASLAKDNADALRAEAAATADLTEKKKAGAAEV